MTISSDGPSGKVLRPSEFQTKRGELLLKAKDIIEGERNLNYGNPEDNFEVIADLWTTYFKRKFTTHDVAMAMILVKTGRLANKPNHYDSLLDIAGYAACAAETI